MPAFAIGTFRGELPRISPRLLPESNAQIAVDCTYEHGNLDPIKADKALDISVKARPKTLFRYTQGRWFSWGEVVNAVNSPVPHDEFDRVYFTGLDVPRYTRQDIAIGSSMPNASIPLGVPKPATALTATANPPPPPAEGETPDEDDIVDASDDETRFYTFTWVTDSGEEGPPADPSNMITLTEPDKQTVDLSLPPLTFNDRRIIKRRVYRTATTGSETEFYLVAELEGAAIKYTDGKSADELSVPLSTQDFFPPPEDLRGLTALANGVLAGFSGNVVCVSESYMPYAWNPNNQLSCEDEIVAIGALPSGAVVVTKGQPYLLQGFTSDSFQLIKLESSAPCVSARSLVDMGSFVIYAGSEGLVMVSGGEPSVVTKSILTTDQWLAMRPETIHAYQYENKYVAFSDAGAFMFDPAGPDITKITSDCSSAFRTPEDAGLVMAVGNKLFKFAGGTGAKEFQWRSRLNRMKSTPLSSAKVVSEGVRFKLYRDGVMIHAEDCPAGEHVFRLPSGYGADWEIELEGSQPVETAAIASSVMELM